MASPSRVFLVGVGYIGQPVLDKLLAANHQVTALVRRPEQASELEKIGVKPCLGTLNDLECIASQSS